MFAKLLTLLPLLAALAIAQQPYPIAKTRTVRVMKRADSTPVADAVVRFVPQGFGAGTARLEDGWLVARHRLVQQLAATRSGRSDAEGWVRLAGPVDAFGQVLVDAPWQRVGLEPWQGFEVLWVEPLPVCEVVVRDAAGAAIADLPLVVRGPGGFEAVAVTDGDGVGRFGIEAATTVGLQVAPDGWLGAGGDLPQVGLAGKRRVAWVMPPFAPVRVRFVHEGAPADAVLRRVMIDGVLRDLHGVAEPCHGVLLPRVAVGRAVAGTLEVGELRLPFASAGPTQSGVAIVIDVEIDPPRPKLRLQVTGLPQGIEGAEPLSVRAVTDAGSQHCRVAIDRDGRALASFDHEALRGQRLRRVDCDFVTGAQTWSGTLAVDRALAPGEIEVGTVALTAAPALLRGRVVDGAGRPVRGARITVQPVAEAFAWMQSQAFVRDDGGFVVRGPLPRGADGAVLPVRGWATVGSDVDRVETAAVAAPADGSDVTLVLVRPVTGSLEVRLADLHLPHHLLDFDFVTADGRHHAIESRRVVWGGGDGHTGRVGPLPPGNGSLRVAIAGIEVARVDDLTVAGEGTADPRLAALALPALTLRRVRAVDANGTPLANVHITYEGAPGAQRLCGVQTKDGFVEGATGPAGLSVWIGAQGMEPRRIEEAADGGDLALGPRATVDVTLPGLPDGVRPEWVSVVLRPVERDNLADAAFATMDAQRRLRVPRPRPGRYFVRVSINPRGEGGGSVQFDAPEVLDLAARPAGPLAIACEVDAATRDRICALLEARTPDSAKPAAK